MLFDVFVGFESEFFLDSLLDREAMTVPSPDTIDTTTSHGPVASDDVLDGRSEHMSVVRHTRDKWRTIIESVWIILGA
jgi:hypothetical protein